MFDVLLRLEYVALGTFLIVFESERYSFLRENGSFLYSSEIPTTESIDS